METARVWLKQVISLLEGRYPALAWYTKTFPSMSLISAAPPPEINTHAIDLAKPNSHEAVQYAIKYWEHLEAGAKYKVFEACKKYVCELLAYAVAVNVPLSPNDMNLLQSWISNAVHRNGVTEEVMKGRCQVGYAQCSLSMDECLTKRRHLSATKKRPEKRTKDTVTYTTFQSSIRI